MGPSGWYVLVQKVALQSPAVASLVAMRQLSATFCPMLLSFPSQSGSLSFPRLGKMSLAQASPLDFNYSSSFPGRRHVAGVGGASTSIWLPGLANLPTLSVSPPFQLMEQAQIVPSSLESTVSPKRAQGSPWNRT